MNFLPITIISIIENLILMIPALLVVAYVTVAERKTMASMQRRLGPNAVGQKNNRFTLKIFYRTSLGIINNINFLGSRAKSSTIRKFYCSLSSPAFIS